MDSLSDGFKALADPNRLRLIGLLRDGELCVCDLMTALEMPQSTVSRHLSYLKKERWVSGRRCGKWMYYKLATPRESLLVKVLDVLRHDMGQYEILLRDQAKLRQHLQAKPLNSCG
ncbi:MAG: ArsR/SmtB family transcription factor [Solidesulfovibrio sp. DCME]|uniref:ArsR/SmtB family transcription factor n=1 Tax=Solidesulfovibrio sp. DCME TaxID=3447380 RepID=UPI003D10D70F